MKNSLILLIAFSIPEFLEEKSSDTFHCLYCILNT